MLARKGVVSISSHTAALLLALITLLTVSLVAVSARLIQHRSSGDSQDSHAAIAQLRADIEKTNESRVVTQPSRIALDPNAGSSAPGTYPQLGYLRPLQGSATTPSGILPLYGRPSLSRRGRGFYYTIIHGSGIKVPVHTKGRSGASGRDCMEDVGCDELLTGDEVTAPDASDAAGLPRDTTWNVVVYKYNRF